MKISKRCGIILDVLAQIIGIIMFGQAAFFLGKIAWNTRDNLVRVQIVLAVAFIILYLPYLTGLMRDTVEARLDEEEED